MSQASLNEKRYNSQHSFSQVNASRKFTIAPRHTSQNMNPYPYPHQQPSSYTNDLSRHSTGRIQMMHNHPSQKQHLLHQVNTNNNGEVQYFQSNSNLPSLNPSSMLTVDNQANQYQHHQQQTQQLKQQEQLSVADQPTSYQPESIMKQLTECKLENKVRLKQVRNLEELIKFNIKTVADKIQADESIMGKGNMKKELQALKQVCDPLLATNSALPKVGQKNFLRQTGGKKMKYRSVFNSRKTTTSEVRKDQKLENLAALQESVDLNNTKQDEQKEEIPQNDSTEGEKEQPKEEDKSVIMNQDQSSKLPISKKSIEQQITDLLKLDDQDPIRKLQLYFKGGPYGKAEDEDDGQRKRHKAPKFMNHILQKYENMRVRELSKQKRSRDEIHPNLNHLLNFDEDQQLLINQSQDGVNQGETNQNSTMKPTSRAESRADALKSEGYLQQIKMNYVSQLENLRKVTQESMFEAVRKFTDFNKGEEGHSSDSERINQMLLRQSHPKQQAPLIDNQSLTTMTQETSLYNLEMLGQKRNSIQKDYLDAVTPTENERINREASMELKKDRLDQPRTSKSVMNRQVDELLDESDLSSNSQDPDEQPKTLKEALWQSQLGGQEINKLSLKQKKQLLERLPAVKATGQVSLLSKIASIKGKNYITYTDKQKEMFGKFQSQNDSIKRIEVIRKRRLLRDFQKQQIKQNQGIQDQQKQEANQRKAIAPFSSKKFIEDLNSPSQNRKARRSTEKSLPTLRRIPATGENSEYENHQTVSRDRTRQASGQSSDRYSKDFGFKSLPQGLNIDIHHRNEIQMSSVENEGIKDQNVAFVVPGSAGSASTNIQQSDIQIRLQNRNSKELLYYIGSGDAQSNSQAGLNLKGNSKMFPATQLKFQGTEFNASDYAVGAAADQASEKATLEGIASSIEQPKPSDNNSEDQPYAQKDQNVRSPFKKEGKYAKSMVGIAAEDGDERNFQHKMSLQSKGVETLKNMTGSLPSRFEKTSSGSLQEGIIGHKASIDESNGKQNKQNVKHVSMSQVESEMERTGNNSENKGFVMQPRITPNKDLENVSIQDFMKDGRVSSQKKLQNLTNLKPESTRQDQTPENVKVQSQRQRGNTDSINSTTRGDAIKEEKTGSVSHENDLSARQNVDTIAELKSLYKDPTSTHLQSQDLRDTDAQIKKQLLNGGIVQNLQDVQPKIQITNLASRATIHQSRPAGSTSQMSHDRSPALLPVTAHQYSTSNLSSALPASAVGAKRRRATKPQKDNETTTQTSAPLIQDVISTRQEGYQSAGECYDNHSYKLMSDVLEGIRIQKQGFQARRFKKFPRFSIYLQRENTQSYLEKNYISLNNQILAYLTSDEQTKEEPFQPENNKNKLDQENELPKIDSIFTSAEDTAQRLSAEGRDSLETRMKPLGSLRNHNKQEIEKTLEMDSPEMSRLNSGRKSDRMDILNRESPTQQQQTVKAQILSQRNDKQAETNQKESPKRKRVGKALFTKKKELPKPKGEQVKTTHLVDPFEKVLLLKNIDNAILTSFRTLSKQNNTISHTFKVIHSKFAPIGVSRKVRDLYKKATSQLYPVSEAETEFYNEATPRNRNTATSKDQIKGQQSMQIGTNVQTTGMDEAMLSSQGLNNRSRMGQMNALKLHRGDQPEFDATFASDAISMKQQLLNQSLTQSSVDALVNATQNITQESSQEVLEIQNTKVKTSENSPTNNKGHQGQSSSGIQQVYRQVSEGGDQKGSANNLQTIVNQIKDTDIDQDQDEDGEVRVEQRNQNENIQAILLNSQEKHQESPMFKTEKNGILIKNPTDSKVINTLRSESENNPSGLITAKEGNLASHSGENLNLAMKIQDVKHSQQNILVANNSNQQSFSTVKLDWKQQSSKNASNTFLNMHPRITSQSKLESDSAYRDGKSAGGGTADQRGMFNFSRGTERQSHEEKSSNVRQSTNYSGLYSRSTKLVQKVAVNHQQAQQSRSPIKATENRVLTPNVFKVEDYLREQPSTGSGERFKGMRGHSQINSIARARALQKSTFAKQVPFQTKKGNVQHLMDQKQQNNTFFSLGKSPKKSDYQLGETQPLEAELARIGGGSESKLKEQIEVSTAQILPTSGTFDKREAVQGKDTAQTGAEIEETLKSLRLEGSEKGVQGQDQVLLQSATLQQNLATLKAADSNLEESVDGVPNREKSQIGSLSQTSQNEESKKVQEGEHPQTRQVMLVRNQAKRYQKTLQQQKNSGPSELLDQSLDPVSSNQGPTNPVLTKVESQKTGQLKIIDASHSVSKLNDYDGASTQEHKTPILTPQRARFGGSQNTGADMTSIEARSQLENQAVNQSNLLDPVVQAREASEAINQGKGNFKLIQIAARPFAAQQESKQRIIIYDKEEEKRAKKRKETKSPPRSTYPSKIGKKSSTLTNQKPQISQQTDLEQTIQSGGETKQYTQRMRQMIDELYAKEKQHVYLNQNTKQDCIGNQNLIFNLQSTHMAARPELLKREERAIHQQYEDIENQLISPRFEFQGYLLGQQADVHQRQNQKIPKKERSYVLKNTKNSIEQVDI